MDFRVSVLPTIWGEKIVLRLLDKGNLQLDMTKLGFDQKPLNDFLWAIKPALGHGPGHRAHRVGARRRRSTPALSDLNKTSHNNLHRRGSRRVQPPRHQPGADARRDRAQLRRGAPLLPPAGPGHPHGRRDPRLRDRRDPRSRRRSRATWCSPPCTPTTPPSTILPPPQHGRRAVPHHRQRQPGAGPAPRPQGLQRLPHRHQGGAPGAHRLRLHPRADRPGNPRQGRRLQDLQRSGYRAASPSTR